MAEGAAIALGSAVALGCVIAAFAVTSADGAGSPEGALAGPGVEGTLATMMITSVAAIAIAPSAAIPVQSAADSRRGWASFQTVGDAVVDSGAGGSSIGGGAEECVVTAG